MTPHANLLIGCLVSALLGAGLGWWFTRRHIRDRELGLQELLSNLPMTMWIRDCAGALRHANSRMKAVPGIEGDASQAMWDPCGHPDALVQEAERQVLSTGKPVLGLMSLLPTPEGPHWVRTDAHPWLASDGRILGVIGIATDITEEHQLQEAAHVLEERFQYIADHLEEFVSMHDAEGLLRFANLNFQTVAGYGEAVLAQLHLVDLIHPEEQVAVQELLQPLFLSGGRVSDLRFRMRFADGTWHWMEADAQTYETPDGARRLLMLSRHIQHRVEQEQLLQAQKVLTERMLDTDPNMVFLKDASGRYLFVNDAMATGLGRPKWEILGRTDRELEAAQAGLDVYEQTDHATLTESDEVSYDEWLTSPDGRTQYSFTVKRRLALPDGTVGIFGVAVDLTQHRALERQIHEQQRRLRTLVDAMPDFVCFKDAAGCWQEANQAALNVFDLEGVDYRGLDDEALARLHPRLAVTFRACRASDQTACDAGTMLCVEELVPQVDGSERVFEVTKVPLKDAVGGHLGMVILGRDVTFSRLVTQALERERMTLRRVIDEHPFAIQILDRQGRVVHHNPALEALFGSLPAVPRSLMDDPLFKAQGLLEQFQRLRDGQRLQVAAHWFDPHQESPELPSRPRCLRTTAFPLGTPEDVREFAVVMHEDITELQEAQDALLKEAQRFASVLEASPAVIFQLDPEGRFLLSSGRGLNRLGLRPGQVVGESVWALYASSPETLAMIRVAMNGQSVSGLVQAAGGEWELFLTPMLGSDGRTQSVVGVATDVTERLRAEAAYRESEARFRALVENTPDHLFWVRVSEGQDLLLEGVNPAMARFHGISGTEGREIRKVLPEPSASRLINQLRLCMETRLPVTFDDEVETSAGVQVFQVLLVPVLDEAGAVRRLVGAGRDVTEARSAAETLRQTQKLESLGVLAGGIAHDFNNLLTAMLGNLNLAQRVQEPSSRAHPYLDQLEKAVEKAAELTQQMLAYSGKGRFVVKRHNLSQSVREMAHLLQVSISKRANLQLQLPESLPSIEADGAQLQQVVMNLVTNASDALENQDGDICVHVAPVVLDGEALHRRFRGQGLLPGAYLMLEVSDSGCGIPPEVLPRIFDPFFTTKRTGRGLGLAAMLGILRAHHAGIEVESHVGQGTCFRVYFPSVPVPAQAADPLPQEPSNRCEGRILVVEDDPVVRETALASLEALGYQVAAACDGVQAVEQVTEAPQAFDLVLMDLTMPRMDGRTAAQHLHGLRPDLPVVLCSGYQEQHTTPEDPIALAGFLQKPYSLRELQRMLTQVLG